MTEPLRPLGLADLRDCDPFQTWAAACDAINAGHKPADVAALLMTLPEGEAVELRDWWREECREVANEGRGRDALCADLLLCRELDALCGNGWHFPMIDPATVLELLDERDRLAQPVRIVCEVEDGALQSVYADRPVDVVKLDFDTDGADLDDLERVPRGGSGQGDAPAFTEDYAATSHAEAADYVNRIHTRP